MTSSKKGQKVVFKTAFDSPFIQWPTLDVQLSYTIQSQSLRYLAPMASLLPRRPDQPKKTDLPSLPKRRKTLTSKRPIIIGLNEVTKALESGQVSVVLACKEDIPHARLLQHLPFLCRWHDALPVALPKGTAPQLTALLGLPKITVIGIRRDEPALQEFVNFLKSVISLPALDLAAFPPLALKRIDFTRRKEKKPTNKT